MYWVCNLGTNVESENKKRRHEGESVGYELLQRCVGEVEAIKSRAGSRAIVDQARRLRAQLLARGTPAGGPAENQLAAVSRVAQGAWHQHPARHRAFPGQLVESDKQGEARARRHICCTTTISK